MITIKYEIQDSRWLKNGKKTTQKQIKEELTKEQLEKLKQDKKLTRRIKTEEEIQKENQQKREKEEQKQKEKEEKILKAVKKDYRIDKGFRHGKRAIEVWRKNHIYGYYNFAFYLDRLEDLDKYILEDVKNLENIKNNKKQQVVDDEI